MDFYHKPPIAPWKERVVDRLTRNIVDDDRHRSRWVRLTRLFMFFFWPRVDYRNVWSCNHGPGCRYVTRSAYDACMLHAALTVY